jgi:threonine dehydratase
MPAMSDLPTLEDSRRAARAIEGIAVRTPLVRSARSDVYGADVLLKLETLQPVGAFKLRGAAYAISRLDQAQRASGVVCASTGNHGRALAYAARQCGIHATVCLSDLVPDVKVNAIEALGAEVRRCGATQEDAEAEVRRLAADGGCVDIPPFDHPDVIAGQGTIGLELLEERADLETIVVPMSGGGLIAGIAMAARALKPSIRVLGVTMDRGAAMAESLRIGRLVDVEELPTLADSLGGGIAGNRYTFRMCRELVDESILVTEQEIYRAMAALLVDEGVVAEGGAAVGYAALLAGKVVPNGPTALVISGRNVDMARLCDIVAGRPVRVGGRVVQAT